jgi:hypothetical protein
MKVDARPGGYVATGGHGGVLGGMGYHGAAVLHYVPALKHTWRSDVNLSKIADSVPVVCLKGKTLSLVDTTIRDSTGDLLEDAIPSVSIVKDGGYFAEEYFDHPAVAADLVSLVEQKLSAGRLAGFVAEGLTPYGTMTSSVRQDVLLKAIYAGLPVVRVGRGSPEGSTRIRGSAVELLPTATDPKGATNDVEQFEGVCSSLGSRLIKSTIQGRQRGKRRPGNLAPACRSGLRRV